MRESRRRRLAARIGAAAAVTAAVFAAAVPNASANGTDGTYKLCSQGTYTSYIKYADGPGGMKGRESNPAFPGECVSIHLDGSPVEVFIVWDSGSSTKIGSSAWYQANIATKGYKATRHWEYF